MEKIESFSNIEYITLEIVGNVDNCLLLDSQIIYKLVSFLKKYHSLLFLWLLSRGQKQPLKIAACTEVGLALLLVAMV